MKHRVRTAEASIHHFPDQTKRKLKLRIDDLNVFDPLTKNQSKFFELYKQGAQAIMLHGAAGTGKTFIALYKALEEVMDKSNPYQRVVLVRSVVPSRDIGHLPGDEKEKTDVYLAPYKAICQDLFDTEQAYERLAEQKNIEFMITSFVRGITIDNAVIIVDECQSMTWHELSSVMTRIGSNAKIIFVGDTKQNDLIKHKNDISGLSRFLEVAKKMKEFHLVDFCTDDIVRSELVKSFLIASEEV